jgi:alpha-ketoglutaric semialdehyde dehydrogenase
MTTMVNGSQLIAGTESREGEQSFSGSNPRTKQPLSQLFFEATYQEIDQALQAARAAFEETRFYPPGRLANFLDLAAQEIENLGDQLLLTTDEETGLGINRLTGERARTTGQLRKFAALLREGSYVEAIIDTARPDRQPAPRPSIRRMLFPLGPVAVFSASNFPFAFAVAGGDTASAFAAGCPVIVKGHPSHPATSELFGRAINRAVASMRFPPGFFSLMQGTSIEVGQTLVTHPDLAAVGFTGSLRAGRSLFDAAAARPKPIPVYAEMGSLNPVVFLPGALAQRGQAILEGFIHSVTLGSGQFCTNPGLVFLIDGPESEAFVSDLAGRMAELQPGVLLNANIERGLAEIVDQSLARPAVERLAGGDVIAGQAYCYANTVLRTTAAAFRSDPDLQVEHFGPVTLLVICEDEADLLTTLSSLHGNLTATVHAGEEEEGLAGRLLSTLREKAGRLIWNGFPTGVEVVYAMQHGGPYPATTAPWTTSVGLAAIKRFMRPVAFQNLPDRLLPPALQNANPLGIWRIVDDHWSQDPAIEE